MGNILHFSGLRYNQKELLRQQRDARAQSMPRGYVDLIARNEIIDSPVYFTGRTRYHEILTRIEQERGFTFSQEQRVSIVEKFIMEPGLVVLEVIFFFYF